MVHLRHLHKHHVSTTSGIRIVAIEIVYKHLCYYIKRKYACVVDSAVAKIMRRGSNSPLVGLIHYIGNRVMVLSIRFFDGFVFWVGK